MEKLVDQREDAEKAFNALQNKKYVDSFEKNEFRLSEFFAEYESDWWNGFGVLSRVKHSLIGKYLWNHWDEIAVVSKKDVVVKKSQTAGVYKKVPTAAAKALKAPGNVPKRKMF